MSHIRSHEISFEDGRKLKVEVTDGVRWFFTLFAQNGKIVDMFSDNVLYNPKGESNEIEKVLSDNGYATGVRMPNGREWLLANNIPDAEGSRVGVYVASLLFGNQSDSERIEEIAQMAKRGFLKSRQTKP